MNQNDPIKNGLHLPERPIRLHVDIGLPPGAGSARINSESWFNSGRRRLGMEAVAGSGALMVTLGYPAGSDAQAPLLKLIEQLSGAGVEVSVIVADLDEAAWLVESPAHHIVLDVTACLTNAGTARRKVERLIGGWSEEASWRPGVMARLTPETAAALPDFMAAAKGAALIELTLPPLIYAQPASRRDLLLGTSHYRALRRQADRLASLAGSFQEVKIHDPYVAAIMAKDVRTGAAEEAFAGCQAAGALAFVSHDGTVYPCAALPWPLGRIEDLAEDSLWSGNARRIARNRAMTGRAPCAVCRRLADCRRGCPAMRLQVDGTLGDEDPLCLAFTVGGDETP